MLYRVKMGRFENLEISIKQKPIPREIEQGYDEVYYLKLAGESQLKGDFELALKYYSRALSYRIDIPEAWIGQVLCLIDLGELDEAIVWADKAGEVIGDNIELTSVKAMALGRNGEFERALAYSDQAIKRGKNSALIWLCRGDIVVLSDFKSAEFCFRKAIEVDKNNPFIYLRIAITFLSVKEPALALANLKKALELSANSPFINYLIGKAYEMLGIIENALGYYEKALKLKPDYKDCIDAYKKLAKTNIFKKIFYWFYRTFFHKGG